MKLYEINEQIQNILNDFVDEETGEIKENVIADIDKLQEEKQSKALNIAKYIKNLTAESEAIYKEETSLKSRRNKLDKQIERLSEYLVLNISGEKIKDAQIEISWRKSQFIEITNADILPKIFTAEKIVSIPDKKAIKNAIEAGAIINGAELKERLNLVIK